MSVFYVSDLYVPKINLCLDLIKVTQILLLLFLFQMFRALRRDSDWVKWSRVRGYIYITIMLIIAWPIIGQIF